jgi:hypothetical protein
MRTPLLAALFCALAPSSALAVGQGETTVTAGPDMVVLFDGQTRAGAGFDIRALHGLTDALAVRLGLQGAWLPGSASTNATRVVAPSLALGLSADVLNLVPFVEAGIVLADLRSSGMPARLRLGGQLAAGADYLLSRRLAVTAVAHADYLALRLAGDGGSVPAELALALHLGYVF